MNDLAFYWGWLAALVLIVITDLNPVEALYTLLGWRYRGRIFDRPIFRWCSRAWRWMTERPRTAYLLIAAAPIAIRVALIPIFPVPQPIIVDEFSHLLLADTFRHGRLTNVTHPMWTHFESIHIIQQPTYNSMYFPGLAIWLAAGWLLGHPYIGVLLCTGAMSGAVVWGLRPYMPLKWAIAGGVLTALRFGIVGYWANSYWGGALGALGGALVVGAYGRMRDRMPRFAWSIWLGSGLAMLALFRPLEGFVFALPFALALVWQAFQVHRNRVTWFIRATGGAVLLLTLMLAGLGTFFKAVTGDPLTPAYVVNQKQYGWPLTLPWQKSEPHTFRHKEMQQYFEWEKEELKKKTTFEGNLSFRPIHIVTLWAFFFGPSITLVLVHLRRTIFSERLRILWISMAGCLLVVGLETGYPHYLSPATVCIVALIIQCIRWARVSRTAILRGTFVLPLLLTVLGATVATRVAAEAFQVPYFGSERGYLTWCCVSRIGEERKKAEETVSVHPGAHVIVVAYDHPKWQTKEWVFNGADIDSQRIIWARDMGPDANRELIAYYPGRQFWIFYADAKPPKVVPYPNGPTARQADRR